MENISETLGSVNQAPPASTTPGSGNSPLTTGLSGAGNRPAPFSHDSSSNTALSTATLTYPESALDRFNSSPSGSIEEGLGDTATLSKKDKEEHNSALPSKPSAAQPYLELANISLDIEKDIKLLNDIINLTVSRNMNIPDNEGYFKENIVITLSKRQSKQIVFCNFVTAINSNLSTSPDLDFVAKFMFVEQKDRTRSEFIIFPSFMFGEKAIAHRALRRTLEAAEKFLDHRKSIDNDINREFFLIIAISMYRFVEFFKNENPDHLNVDDIEKITSGFKNLYNLGVAIENNYSLPAQDRM